MLFSFHNNLRTGLVVFLLIPSLGMGNIERGEDVRPPQSSLDGIKAALKDDNPDVLVAIVTFSVSTKAIESIKENGSDIVARLEGLLTDDDPVTREAAIKALGWIGQPCEQIATSAAKLLHDEYPPVVIGAIWTLGRIGKCGNPYAKIVLTFLDPQYDKKTRLAAIRAMATIGQPELHDDQIGLLLEDPDWDITWETANTLVKIGTFKSAQIVNLETNDWRTTRLSIAVLANMGPEAKPYIPQLSNLLKDASARIRFAAARALGQLGIVARDAVPQLITALEDPRVSVRTEAARAIMEVGTDLEPYLPIFITKLDDYHGSVRLAMAGAFAKVNENAARAALPNLLSMLKNPKPQTRSASARAIGYLGSVAKDHTSHVAELVKDSSTQVLEDVAFALGRIDPSCPTALSPLFYLLDNAEPSVHRAAAEAIAQCAPLLDTTHREVSVWSLIAMAHADPRRTGTLRFLAHLVGAGAKEAETLLTWLGNPIVYPEGLSRADAVQALLVLEDAWQRTRNFGKHFKRFRTEINETVGLIFDQVQWNRSDAPSLKAIASKATPAGLAAQRVLDTFKCEDVWCSERQNLHSSTTSKVTPPSPDGIGSLFSQIERSIRDSDLNLFKKHWDKKGYSYNLVGNSGLAGGEVFRQGHKKGWYLEPVLNDIARFSDYLYLVPCKVVTRSTGESVDFVYAAVAYSDSAWMILGAGEKREEVEALVERYVNK